MKTDITVVGFVFEKNKVLLIYNTTYKMWLGPGGHLRENETPDSQIIKKMKSEVGLDVKILSKSPDIILSDNTVRNCPLPFHADIHNVGDHFHYAQYYVCVKEFKDQDVVLDNGALTKYSWLTKEELITNKEIGTKTKNIVSEAFRYYSSF